MVRPVSDNGNYNNLINSSIPETFAHPSRVVTKMIPVHNIICSNTNILHYF